MTARRPVLFNPRAQALRTISPSQIGDAVAQFHKRLPGYAPTRLISLGDVAKKLGVAAVHVKCESSRFGLSSFKILGASWGSFRALCEILGLPLDADLEAVRVALKETPTKLYAATDGNHGRAVAFMAALLEIEAEIHVPSWMREESMDGLREEGAHVLVSSGTYDDAVAEAFEASKRDEGGILIQDTAWQGYEDVPQWIVDGYSTMMHEVDQQLGERPDLVVVPVGVGSFAQAVVSHVKTSGEKRTRVLTVEPDTSACLYKSLKNGGKEPVVANGPPSIMAGLDCATPSSIAWPILRSGVDASVSVSNYEAHEACEYLKRLDISAGPCGAAPLAALQRLDRSDTERLGLDETSVVVIFCTEGERPHDVPHDVAGSDPVALTQTLVRINSANPSLGSPATAPGEVEIARYVTAWLEHRDIEAHWIEPTKGRPSVVGVVRGTDGGRSLMLNGHLDTVTLAGYDGDPLQGKIENGKLYGRGAADMKCGVAAALIALANAKQLRLSGDVIFAGVADEEHVSIGTEQVLEAGWRADAAIVTEPTDMDIIHAHKGFVWLEVDIHGVAAHGSRPDLGVDAICMAGFFLVELHKHGLGLASSASAQSVIGPGSIHASLISGGEEASSYPAHCKVTLERRTVAGETAESVGQEIKAILDKLVETIPNFAYRLSTTFSRSPFNVPIDHPFTALVRRHVGEALGREDAVVTTAPYWTDCALLGDAGMPALLFGPRGDGLHGKEEWVDVQSIVQTTEALTATVAEFCQ